MNAARERLDSFRTVATIAALVGAVGSVALTIRASHNTPRFLLLLMSVWTGGPFLVLLFAIAKSESRPTIMKATLYGSTLILAVVCLVIYYLDAQVRPAKAPPAYFFVLVPPVALLVTVVALAIAAFVRRRSPA